MTKFNYDKTMFSEEASVLFGFVKLERVGGLSVLSMLGVPVFQRVGESSVLFGVNWND